MDLRERLASDVSRRTLLAVGAVGLFVLLFPVGHSLFGNAVGALALLPVVAVAAAYGPRAGVAAALLAAPVNALLFEFVGEAGREIAFGASLTGHAAGVVVAYLVGHYRVTLDRLRRTERAHAHAVSQRLAREADLVRTKEAQRAELEALVAREQRANEELKAINAMKDGFLQAVSHELRTPLTSVRGFASTLARHRHEMAPDAADTLFDRLVANADKLDRLLNDLLDVDRLERGIIEPRRTPVELGRLVCEIADNFETGSRRLQLEVEDITAWVDGPKVERIVENLLGNAIKHTPEGTSLGLGLVRSPQGVRLEMRQSGVPVPDDLKAAIFEPFRQGPLRTEHQPGTGIGLSLVARFAALHEGRAWVEDTSDGGAVFCVELRADLVDAPTVPGRRAAQA